MVKLDIKKKKSGKMELYVGSLLVLSVILLNDSNLI